MSEPARGRVVRVLPDVPAIDKTFDYEVPPDLRGASSVGVGTVVRVELHGRRVGAWVVEDDVVPPPGVTVRAISKVTGRGPDRALIELASWAAWRWAGRRASFLRTASPPTAVRALPEPARPTAPVALSADAAVEALATDALEHGATSVVRLPPSADDSTVALAAARRGDALVLCPSLRRAREVAGRLRRAGVPVALMDRDWARAAAGATVVGTRSAAWSPLPAPAAVVVLDEHDAAYQEERTPTWHARDVVVERARRAGVPVVLTSPVPSLESLRLGPLLTASRSTERAGWPVLEVVDRRDEEPGRTGLYTERLVRALRREGRVACVLNRTGRAGLLACASCGELTRCERCGSSMRETDDHRLLCRRGDSERPLVCQACGQVRLKKLRVGVGRAREELEALLREPVAEVTAATAGGELPPVRVFVGTEAVLHQLEHADTVAFLDLDQELLAPRFRAADEAMSLVVRAARLVGGRDGGGRVVVQTRMPRHEVLVAALHADPGRLSAAEDERRRSLRFPPHSALARLSGPAAPAYLERLGRPAGVEVLGPADGAWLLRAADHGALCDALAAVERPPGRLRLEVDPLRV